MGLARGVEMGLVILPEVATEEWKQMNKVLVSFLWTEVIPEEKGKNTAKPRTGDSFAQPASGRL